MQGCFPAPLCAPETLRFLPPQGTGGGMLARSGERGGKTRCPRGLDQGSDAGTAPHRAGPAPRAEGAPAPGLQPHQCRAPVPTAGLPGVRHPGHLPHPLARRGSGPLVLSCTSSAAPAGARGLNLPQPPFLPQRKQRCLSGGSAPHPGGGSEAQRQRWETGGSCQAGLGAAQLVPEGPAPSGHSLPSGVGVFGTGGAEDGWSWGARGRGLRKAQIPDLRPRLAQRTHGRPSSADPKGSARG